MVLPQGRAALRPRRGAATGRRGARRARGGVSLLYPNSGPARPYKATAELLQAALRPLGLGVKILALEGAAATEQLNRGDWHLRFQQQNWTNGDPDFIFQHFLHATGRDQTGTKSGYKNRDVAELLVIARPTPETIEHGRA